MPMYRATFKTSVIFEPRFKSSEMHGGEIVCLVLKLGLNGKVELYLSQISINKEEKKNE